MLNWTNRNGKLWERNGRHCDDPNKTTTKRERDWIRKSPPNVKYSDSALGRGYMSSFSVEFRALNLGAGRTLLTYCAVQCSKILSSGGRAQELGV